MLYVWPGTRPWQLRCGQQAVANEGEYLSTREARGCQSQRRMLVQQKAGKLAEA